MPPLDPRQLITSLRDHLARHDKPIAFLIGAGASSAVRVDRDGHGLTSLIPNTTALTGLCKESVSALGNNFAAGWDLLVEECQSLGEDPHIENLLSRIRLKFDAIGAGDELIGLTKDEISQIDTVIRETIANAALPNDVPDELPHHELAKWIMKASRRLPIEIFTLNYDLLIEKALEDERLPVFDGFVGSNEPFFYPDSLIHQDAAPGLNWVRLWKIHGSVNWKYKTNGNRSRIIRTEPSPVGELILPSLRKYDESRKQPYVALLDHLARFLEHPDSLLVTVGYSFRDQHVNEIIFEALEHQGRGHVYALMFEEPDELSDLLLRAQRQPRLVVVGPETGVVGTARGKWRLAEPVQDTTADMLDLAFDSDALVPDEVTSIPLTGRMRLGNFIYLCRFLGSLSLGEA